jgi:hypothetical protein
MSNRLPKFSVPGCCVSPTLERRQRLADAPLLYRASYNDREQGLTDAEVYAARVNDWHAAADRLNGNYAAIIRSGEWGTAHLAGRLGNQARPHVQHATPHWFATQVV